MSKERKKKRRGEKRREERNKRRIREEPFGSAQGKSSCGGFGAVEWIRTTTVLLPPAPQAGASASSATTALR
jgi:hypothetical protein